MNNEEIRVEVNEEVIELKVEVEETIVEVKAIGEKGQQGPQGQTGATPNISVKSTTTLPAGSNATVELDASSTPENPKFNFGIPKGDTGEVSEEELEEVDEKVIATRNELNRVRDVILETGTASNSNITLNDSVMSELQALNVEGVCQQTTTTGKQLIPYIAEDYTALGITLHCENGNLYFNGTSSSVIQDTANLMFKQRLNFTLQAGTYYFTRKNNTRTTRIHNFNNDDILAELIINTSVYSTTFTLTEETKVYMGIYIASGITLNNIDFGIMVSTSGGTYEPYTGGQASPNPSYPQPISVIENSIKLTSCGKNKFKNTSFSTATRGLTFTNDGKTITANGTVDSGYYPSIVMYADGSYSAREWWPDNNSKKPAKGYFNSSDVNNIISIISSGTKSGNFRYFIGRETNFNYYDIYSVGTNSYAINQDTEKINFIAIGFVPSKTYNLEFKVQIEENSTTTTYEPYEETSITASLGNEFMGKYDNTLRDILSIEYNQNDGQYHKMLYKFIGKVVLDNSKVYGQYRFGTGYTTFFHNLNGIKFGKVISNYFISDYNFVYNASDNGIYCLQDNNIYISIANSNLSEVSVNGFKTWLSTHNIIGYYILKTPYVVDLGVCEMPLSYNNITHIFTDSALQPIVNVVYYRDFTTTVQNLQINEDTLRNELIDLEERVLALESASNEVVE